MFVLKYFFLDQIMYENKYYSTIRNIGWIYTISREFNFNVAIFIVSIEFYFNITATCTLVGAWEKTFDIFITIFIFLKVWKYQRPQYRK